MNKIKYLELINPAMDLVVKKHEDYNAGGIELAEYFPLGHVSYTQMLHVKTMRLVSLCKSERAPNFESVVDTVNDLINYAVFYLEYLEYLEYLGEKNGK